MVVKKRYASVLDKPIKAMIQGTFRFAEAADAQKKIEEQRSDLIFSKAKEGEEGECRDKLWIQGYEITEEEGKQGFLGNFAELEVKWRSGHCTILAKKVKIPVKYHPKKDNVGEHPGWGHSLLRQVRKGSSFRSIEDARDRLSRLCQEYPKVTIPTLEKFYIIVYSKEYGPSRTRKFVFRPIEREGSVIIDYYENRNQTPIARKKADDTIDSLVVHFDDYEGAADAMPSPPVEAAETSSTDASPLMSGQDAAVVIADQQWLRATKTRIDFVENRRSLGNGPEHIFVLACPNIEPLWKFRKAAIHAGWSLLDTPGGISSNRVGVIVDFLAALPRDTKITLITGDKVLLDQVSEAGVSVAVLDNI